MLENVSNALENGDCALGIFLDFQKASSVVFVLSIESGKQSVFYNGHSSQL